METNWSIHESLGVKFEYFSNNASISEKKGNTALKICRNFAANLEDDRATKIFVHSSSPNLFFQKIYEKQADFENEFKRFSNKISQIFCKKMLILSHKVSSFGKYVKYFFHYLLSVFWH